MLNLGKGSLVDYLTLLLTSSCKFFVCLFVFWLCSAACRILVPQPGIEPGPPAVQVQSPNHWTARESQIFFCMIYFGGFRWVF